MMTYLKVNYSILREAHYSHSYQHEVDRFTIQMQPQLRGIYFLTCVKNFICIVKMSTKCFMWWQVIYLNMSVIIYSENHIFFIHVRKNFDEFTIKMQPQLWGIYFYLCVKKLSQSYCIGIILRVLECALNYLKHVM